MSDTKHRFEPFDIVLFCIAIVVVSFNWLGKLTGTAEEEPEEVSF